MDKVHYREMKENLALLSEENVLSECSIYLFGHCNATEELADLLIGQGYRVKGILDNSTFKQGQTYKAIPIVPPYEVMREDDRNTLVCIVSRFYAAMAEQLKAMGYEGRIRKLVDYDSYAEYSLSEETLHRKRERLEKGIHLLERQKRECYGFYRIYCPFPALGDVYYAMAYLPYFLKKKEIQKYVVFTVGYSCGEVARMFGVEQVEILSQREMDETVQAVLQTKDTEAYIAHHDCPYAVQLMKALYVKKISLETIYKCGVFGLEKSMLPYKPKKIRQYSSLEKIIPGRAVVLAPYAKSVILISGGHWKQIVEYYAEKGWQVFTNVAGEEEALEGTMRLQVKLAELQSVVEQAGTFIGIRSGLCDVLKEAACRKIALYPNCYYSNSKWKIEDIFWLDGFENIVV